MFNRITESNKKNTRHGTIYYNSDKLWLPKNASLICDIKIPKSCANTRGLAKTVFNQYLDKIKDYPDKIAPLVTQTLTISKEQNDTDEGEAQLSTNDFATVKFDSSDYSTTVILSYQNDKGYDDGIIINGSHKQMKNIKSLASSFSKFSSNTLVADKETTMDNHEKVKKDIDEISNKHIDLIKEIDNACAEKAKKFDSLLSESKEEYQKQKEKICKKLDIEYENVKENDLEQKIQECDDSNLFRNYYICKTKYDTMEEVKSLLGNLIKQTSNISVYSNNQSDKCKQIVDKRFDKNVGQFVFPVYENLDKCKNSQITMENEYQKTIENVNNNKLKMMQDAMNITEQCSHVSVEKKHINYQQIQPEVNMGDHFNDSDN